MMARRIAPTMTRHRSGSLVALAAGLVLVFAGLTSALGFSITGMIASGAAIAALLYAGGVWFGEPASRSASDVVLFTRDLLVASGSALGRPIGELFPESSRETVERHCRLVLEGRAAKFLVAPGQLVTVSPVRSPEGAVVGAVLLSGRAAEAVAIELTSAL
jgi:hypothetical protein